MVVLELFYFFFLFAEEMFSWLKVCLGNEALFLFQTFAPFPLGNALVSGQHLPAELTHFPSLSLVSLFPPVVLGSLPILAKRGTLVAHDSIYRVFVSLLVRISSREILEGSAVILHS